jgi:hypothetical protein
MTVDLTTWFSLAALLLAGIMGFAIQRGATCTVAAVEEWFTRRRITRLVSIIEASLLVAAGLLIANTLGALTRAPSGFPTSIWVVVGGVLLGLGAFINQACVFGAVARLGSGEWSYIATPIGFYAGCVSLGYVIKHVRLSQPLPLPTASPLFAVDTWLALAIVLLLVFVPYALAIRRSRARLRLAPRVWSPRVATAVIGITFLLLLLMMGAWAYTDVLAELARGMYMNLVTRGLLLLALFIGALIGGWTAGRFASRGFSSRQLAQCLIGGIVMGWGSLLIPGSNDGLVLLGMPLLWPYAWVAFVAMCASIALAMMIRRRWFGTGETGIGI